MTDIARKIDEAAHKLATGVTVTDADLNRASRVVFIEEVEALQRLMAEQAETIRKMEAKLSGLSSQHFQARTKGWDE